MQEMKITKDTDLNYTVLCLNQAENIRKVVYLFNGEVRRELNEKIEIKLNQVGRELNINIFIFAKEMGKEIPSIEDVDFTNHKEYDHYEEMLGYLLVDLQHFVYGKEWLSAVCRSYAHEHERYGGE